MRKSDNIVKMHEILIAKKKKKYINFLHENAFNIIVCVIVKKS
jgi:hypothetical protein